MHTRDELREKQALPLDIKISMTRLRLREWVSRFGYDGVYVSFSGGKDSTVLLDIARQMFPDIKAVFVDTGLEYPEIRDFVGTFDNVDWLKPEMSFRKVIETYGYPFISKEVSECVEGARKYLTQIETEAESLRTNERTNKPYHYQFDKLLGQGVYRKHGGGTKLNEEELADILNQRMVNREGGNNQRLAIMLGMLTNDKEHPIQANVTEGNKSMFSQEKYKFFLCAPFEISNKCCNVMKKKPAKKYAKEKGRVPITAQMASESQLRTQKWLQHGCNAFDTKNPISNPMSFWTEQDVLRYIQRFDLPIADVYGDIVTDYDAMKQLEGQMTLEDTVEKPLKTTGCNRTGCMFCGFGCHLEKSPNRFERLKETHPDLYEYIMRPWESEQDGRKVTGLGFKEVIDWINENGNMNIKY